MFVGVGSNYTVKSPLYLGTSEAAPEIVVDYRYTPIMTDVSGELPHDRIYAGSEATISAVLTRWNESVMKRLMSNPKFLGIRGKEEFGSVGSMMGYEGYAFPLWIKFPYVTKDQSTDMPPGYRFWSCVFMPDKIMPGTKAKRHQVMFQAQRASAGPESSPEDAPLPQRSSLAIGQEQTYMLYDNNLGSDNLPEID